MKKLLKEPLIHFLFFGFLLFVYYQWQNDHDDPGDKTIVLSDADLDRLVSNYQMSWNQPPSRETLQRLVHEEIKSEIYYKEALGMGLDDNDEIIRRRLKQKYEFIMKDLGEQMNPSDQELKVYYDKHQSSYKGDRKITFAQFYFSPDNHKNPKAKAVLELEKHKSRSSTSNLNFGDRSHLDKDWNNVTPARLRQTFGNKFESSLSKIKELGWTQPIESGLGFHVLYVSEILPSQLLPFDEIKDKVNQDWTQSKTVQLDSINFSILQEEYAIEYNGTKYAEAISL